ncbi:MAG: hypothetical protein AAF653_21650, partial [Chloroflexota bacterium]
MNKNKTTQQTNVELVVRMIDEGRLDIGLIDVINSAMIRCRNIGNEFGSIADENAALRRKLMELEAENDALRNAMDKSIHEIYREGYIDGAKAANEAENEIDKNFRNPLTNLIGACRHVCGVIDGIGIN